ncbi:MAG TPA: hypothetical protein VHP36_10575 [Chitinispirillaceae bacterium]|nr:hypothetical protein [Chitinispirillaceae bacterium]
MKSAPLFLIYIISVTVFWLFSNPSKDQFEISPSHTVSHSCSPVQSSHSSDLILEMPQNETPGFWVLPKPGNRYRFIRKPVFCIGMQIKMDQLVFQSHNPAYSLPSVANRPGLPLFPLRI